MKNASPIIAATGIAIVGNSGISTEPKCDVLFNVLYQMGIHPNMETFTLGRTEAYETLDEAVDNLSSHFSLKNDDQKKILEQYLEKTLQKENGNYIYDACSKRVKIW
ncbi:hypothetical protein RE474_09280 [Methanolobus sediminis]|uniref:Uncharacterized protein n=2 Tax=Methanolobus sediminis TaxID=3072978 RepID=A0AA51UIZ5_9EURY|nr:hypothetical protein [Methanolobus sediminis]WMW24285.1 hypothetical protein RE474_09280 [Methanolobus sediminis]